MNNVFFLNENNKVKIIERITGAGTSIRLQEQFSLECKKFLVINARNSHFYSIFNPDEYEIIIIDEFQRLHMREFQDWLLKISEKEVYFLQYPESDYFPKIEIEKRKMI